jgi:hypothetical protein
MSERKPAKVVSLSGSAILRHGEPSPWRAARGAPCLEEISNHIEMCLGRIDSVFHELVSDTVHLDVHVVRPSPAFPYVRLVTSGMSDLPMATPEGAGVPRFAELLMTLPAGWKLDNASLRHEKWFWPIRLLKDLARLPHKHATWLGFGHSVPNGDPPEAFARGTKLCAAVVVPSISVPDVFHELRIDDDKTITFYAVVPLFEEELNLKLRLGSDALLERFGKKRISDIIDLSRPNVGKTPLGPF